MKRSQYMRGMTRRERKAWLVQQKLRAIRARELMPSAPSGPTHWITLDELRELYPESEA